MQDSRAYLGEEDLELINALQLRPRASWTELGRALEVDPVTVARRWRRLRESRAAWVCVSPGPALGHQCCTGYLDIECAEHAAAAVGAELVTHPHVLSLEYLSRGNRMLAIVATRDVETMARYCLDVLPGMRHIGAVHTHMVTHRFAEGGDWRLDALAPERISRLRGYDRGTRGHGARRITPLDRALIRALSDDGRATHTALARALGVGAPVVKRRLDDLVRIGLIGFRCDFARPLAGWPITVTLRAAVPAAHLMSAGNGIVGLSQTRNCVAVAGTANLLVQACLHGPAEVNHYERLLATIHPDVSIMERALTFRHAKRLGHILDDDGKVSRVVPPDIWTPPPAPSGGRRR